MNQAQNIVKEELKFISIDNCFEEFCCRREQRSGAVYRRRSRVRKEYPFFKIGEITTRLYGNRNDPLEREILMMQKEEGRIVKLVSLSMQEE